MSRQGQNYFETCGTCGGLGHDEDSCPLKAHYHRQAQIQVARGSRDPEILREVYGAQLDKQELHRC